MGERNSKKGKNKMHDIILEEIASSSVVMRIKREDLIIIPASDLKKILKKCFEEHSNNCSNCKHIVECNIDKQAFYKLTEKQCEGWEAMTDNDIKKALEIHADNEVGCSECPIYHSDTGGTCAYELAQNALDLINRKKAEIERLEREIEDLESTQEITPEAKHLVDTKADKVISLMNEIIKSQDQIKSEAITEFAERLCEDRVSNDPVVIAVKTELKMMKEGVNNA